MIGIIKIKRLLKYKLWVSSSISIKTKGECGLLYTKWNKNQNFLEYEWGPSSF